MANVIHCSDLIANARAQTLAAMQARARQPVAAAAAAATATPVFNQGGDSSKAAEIAALKAAIARLEAGLLVVETPQALPSPPLPTPTPVPKQDVGAASAAPEATALDEKVTPAQAAVAKKDKKKKEVKFNNNDMSDTESEDSDKDEGDEDEDEDEDEDMAAQRKEDEKRLNEKCREAQRLKRQAEACLMIREAEFKAACQTNGCRARLAARCEWIRAEYDDAVAALEVSTRNFNRAVFRDPEAEEPEALERHRKRVASREKAAIEKDEEVKKAQLCAACLGNNGSASSAAVAIPATSVDGKADKKQVQSAPARTSLPAEALSMASALLLSASAGSSSSPSAAAVAAAGRGVDVVVDLTEDGGDQGCPKKPEVVHPRLDQKHTPKVAPGGPMPVSPQVVSRAPAKRAVVPLTVSVAAPSASSSASSCIAVDSLPASNALPGVFFEGAIVGYATERVVQQNQIVCRMVLALCANGAQVAKRLTKARAAALVRQSLLTTIAMEAPVLRFRDLKKYIAHASREQVTFAEWAVASEEVSEAFAVLMHEREKLNALLRKDNAEHVKTLQCMEKTFDLSETKEIKRVLQNASSGKMERPQIAEFFLGLPIIPGLSGGGMPDEEDPEDAELRGFAPIDLSSFKAAVADGSSTGGGNKRKQVADSESAPKRQRADAPQASSSSASASASSAGAK